MRELIESNPAHWKDEHALELLRALCRKAFAVMRDPMCRAYLAAVDDYAAALPWQHDLAGWSPGRMLGPWLVRREVLRKLRLLSERLSALEQAPASPPQAAEAAPSLIATSAPVRQLAGRRRERYANALRLAAERVGGTARLAFVLRVPRQDLERWMEGYGEAPLESFLSALDLIAAAPLERESASVSREPVASPPARARAFEGALFALLVGTALVGLGGWVAYFRGTPGLTAGAAFAGWLCVGALVLVRCMRAQSEATSVRIALLGSAVLFGAGMLLVPRAEQAAVPAARPHLQTAASSQPAVALAKVTMTRAEEGHAPAPRTAPKMHKAAAGASAKPGAARAAALDIAEPRCSSLTALASLQCLRCEQETGVQWWLCQEKVRLQYCDGRDGTEAQCPSVIPASLSQ